jgi:hypothetical protein
MFFALKAMNNPIVSSKGVSIVARTKHKVIGNTKKKVTTVLKLTRQSYKIIQRYKRAYAADFATQTSPEINAELNSHFEPWVATYLKEMWGMMEADQMASAKGIKIAQTALDAVAVVDFSGVVSVVGAYTQPVCGPIVPFPGCVTNENGCEG